MSYPFSSKVLLVFSGIRPAASASGLTLPLEVCALTNNSLTLSNHCPQPAVLKFPIYFSFDSWLKSSSFLFETILYSWSAHWPILLWLR